VSYFEQVQNNTNYYRPEAEVNGKLEAIMRPATLDVVNTAQKYKTTLRN
jgi:glutamate dehydrogenase/leucine dehydrogenase